MLSLSERLQISCEFVSDEVEESLRIKVPSCHLTNATTKHWKLKQDVDSCSQHIEGAWNRRMFPAVELLALLILCSSCANVDCRLHRKPHNVAERVGKEVFMSCASNSTVHPCQDMVWTHYTAHALDPNDICKGDNLSPLVSHYISIVDLSDGKCNLKIKTQTSAEGKYECYSTTTGKSASASLIILADYPECLVKTVVNETGEYSNITCSVEYFGDWTPTMEWIKMTEQNSTIVSSFESHASNQIVSSNLVVPRNASAGYKCIMKFNEQGRKTKTTATNVPDYKWTSPTFEGYGGEARRQKKMCSKDCVGLNKSNSFVFNGRVVITSLFLWFLLS